MNIYKKKKTKAKTKTKNREEGCGNGQKMYYAFVNIHIFKMNNWWRKEYISSKKTWKSEDGNRKIEREVRSKDYL